MTKRILNVDDDPMIRELVRAILESSEFEVLSAENGTEAIELLEHEKRPIDLTCIVLDVQMPDMSGFDVLTRLKLHADTQNIPVIMLTCQSSPDDFMNGYNIGADYYITKPFTREQLIYGINLVTS
ncbi:MAG: response regulator [Bdellovibrionales bacterium]|nr:response regulator [Bdellovibrionales bacterium]